jgi:type VI secretion system protein ImpE
MTAAEDSFRTGDLAAALAQLQAEIRQKPADLKLRVFLAQLLMIEGQWERALNQLQVIEELDAGALPMVRTYQHAIQCERLRAGVFAGERTPLIFGDPEQWIGLLAQSVSLFGKGHASQAADLRAQAFEAAPESKGSLNGARFEWLADGDSRLGPVFEVLLNGNYYWIPMHRIQRVVIEAPEDARDLVWTPANFTWTNGGEAPGLIPTRYPGSEKSEDNAIRMSRKTEWQELKPQGYLGSGQRILMSDVAEVGLLEVRELIFDEATV